MEADFMKNINNINKAATQDNKNRTKLDELKAYGQKQDQKQPLDRQQGSHGQGGGSGAGHQTGGGKQGGTNTDFGKNKDNKNLGGGQR